MPDILRVSQRLNPGDKLTSANGTFKLKFPIGWQSSFVCCFFQSFGQRSDRGNNTDKSRDLEHLHGEQGRNSLRVAGGRKFRDIQGWRRYT